MPKTLLILIALFPFIHTKEALPDSKLAADTRATVWPKLTKELKDKGLTPGNPIFIRVFKN